MNFFCRLAHHARNTGDCVLREWLNERKTAEFCARIVAPDAYGEWTENGVIVKFFLEFDNGTEKIDDVTRKLDGYRELSRAGMAIPILFVFAHPRSTDRYDLNIRGGELPGADADQGVATV
ncbi:replication-relaxation family protein [Nocardia sp. NBC_01009]|uniref:replication-relaxation family protein n=1 Tax=Nocardia sp. NBC_01009 TaxID=2975996 RepID=UPI00386EFA52|nr:replication-relaxation family protein [Nocardia sp. NBC_01009]